MTSDILGSEETLNQETWLDIPGYTGYQVSSWSRIRSFRNHQGNIEAEPVKILQAKYRRSKGNCVRLIGDDGVRRDRSIRYWLSLVKK